MMMESTPFSRKLNYLLVSAAGISACTLAYYLLNNRTKLIHQQQQKHELEQQSLETEKRLVEEKIRIVEFNLAMNRPEMAYSIIKEVLTIDPSHFEANCLLVYTEISIIKGARQQLQTLGNVFPVRLNRSSLGSEASKLLTANNRKRHQRKRSFFAEQAETVQKAKTAALYVTSDQIEKHVQYLKTLIKTEKQRASADLLFFTWDLENHIVQSSSSSKKKRKLDTQADIAKRLTDLLSTVDDLLQKDSTDADLILLRMYYKSTVGGNLLEMETDLQTLVHMYEKSRDGVKSDEQESVSLVTDIMIGKAYFYCAICANDNEDLEINYLNLALDHFPEMFEALSRRAKYLFRRQNGHLSIEILKDLSIMMQLNSEDPVFDYFCSEVQ